MAARLLLLLVLCLPLPLRAQGYWAQTHLDFRHLEHVALAKCYDALKQLIGCYRAVGGALGTGGDLQVSAAPPQDSAIPVRAFGIVSFFRSSRDDAASSVYEYWRELVAQRSRDLQALEAHFRDPGAQRIDFGAIVAFLKERTPAQQEAERAARGINEYFAVVFDPHTQLSTRRDLAEALSGQDRSYIGIGINLYKLGTRYLVTSVHPDGPAFAQGVKANDFLTHVDGRETRALTLEQLVGLVRGEQNTAVTLGLRRDGKRLDIVVPRRNISRRALETRRLRSQAGSYGYVRLQDFMNERACEQTAAALRNHRAQGWILDLRGNTGGALPNAVCVAGLFLGAPTLVAYKIDAETGRRQDYSATSDKVSSAPLAILVDGASASGSELLAGAIQDAARGWIVGERTFGKGTAQSVRGFPLPGTSGLVRSDTTGLFFLASGRTTQLEGITPDFVVPARPDASDAERFVPREQDAYIAPIAHSQQPWISTRPQETEKISVCVAREGKAGRGDIDSGEPDYQLRYALDVLDCQRKTSQPAP